MDTPIVSSDPPANPIKPTKVKKRKMNAAGRKAVSEAAKARWAAKNAAAIPQSESTLPAIAIPAAPSAPSPAVLKLQEQVVELVSQRHQARTLLNEAHNAYLAAQSRFQAAEGELKGIEQEVQYRISLIAQLENRQNITAPTLTADMVNSPNFGSESRFLMPATGSITSEPAPQRFAVALADDVKRDFRGMM